MKKNQWLNLVVVFIVMPFAALNVYADAPELAAMQPGWNTVKTDGLCSTGTPYQFLVRPAEVESQNLLIYFNGGGACWFGEACDLNSQPNVHTPFADMPANQPRDQGIFAFGNTENPLRNYHMVFLPYCTGDVFVGAGPHEYVYTNADGKEIKLTTYHNGNANTNIVLQWVYKNFKSPAKILVSGSSAGAIGSSFYSGLIADHYPQTPTIILGDAAGGYNSPFLYKTFNVWNTAALLPNWPEYAGKTNENLTYEDFYIASALHNPNLTIAQYNAANDDVQNRFLLLIGDLPGSFTIPERILQDYLQIENAVNNFYTYTAGGTVHTILQSDLVYQYQVQNVRFVDWLRDLINGKAVDDISCVDEARGCANAPNVPGA